VGEEVIGLRKNRGRLTEPMVRVNGSLRPVGWDEALDVAAAGLARARAQDATRSFGMFSCSKASNEVNFLAQKFVRSALGSNNIDSCNRT
jgi:formate dehydrogenase (hydrogenase)